MNMPSFARVYLLRPTFDGFFPVMEISIISSSLGKIEERTKELPQFQGFHECESGTNFFETTFHPAIYSDMHTHNTMTQHNDTTQ
jgi:hypothetical protein